MARATIDLSALAAKKLSASLVWSTVAIATPAFIEPTSADTVVEVVVSSAVWRLGAEEVCLKRAYPETAYERWIREERLPAVTGHGVEDILSVPRGEWQRRGGRGVVLKLQGFEGMTGMYVGEVPPGGALNPEKHLYEEIIYILRGRGSTEVQSAATGKKAFFEWNTGSLFAIPINNPYRLFNASGTEPAVFLGFTNAPILMDMFGRLDFVLENNFIFDDRYIDTDSYFSESDVRYGTEYAPVTQWDTSYVTDVRNAQLNSGEYKGKDRRTVVLEMAGGVLVTHIAEWPAGRHDKAHHHGGGAALLIVRGSGYSLMWPASAGPRPFAAGLGDRVVRINWREGSIFSPPTGWFHQHFNTGSVSARQLALRYGTRKRGVEFVDAQRGAGLHVSVKEGGTLIPYEDQDQEITRLFAEECAAAGTMNLMADVMEVPSATRQVAAE